jgi:type VI secretion system secreted protein VgrG
LRLTPGRTFSLSGHDFSALDKEYVFISVRHVGGQSHVLGEQTGIGGDYTYSNSFTVVPSAVAIRPGKSIGKPVIHGLQSAIVVGPENEEIYVDEYGRVKVRFQSLGLPYPTH